MERKFELTCTHTVWSIVGCPFSLCRRPTSAAPIQISGKWLFENFTPPGKRPKTVLELQVRYFHLANQVLWKGKLTSTAMKQDTRVDTSCSEQRMGKSWLRTGSGSRVACEQTVNRLSVWGKVPPRGDVFFEQNIKTRRKPLKNGYFVTFSLHILHTAKDWGLRETCRAPARIWLAVIDFQNGEQQSRSGSDKKRRNRLR